MTFTASQSGTYYVRASGDRDETGSYTLRVSDVTPVSVEDPPPVEPPAETVAPEEPEPARAAAEDLGDITELAAPRFPLGTLDGGADAVAWYRFTLSEAREVALGLRRQDADADLVLEDAAGNVLHSSERSGTTNEWLRETLLAGTYYVRVEAQEAGANAYVFRYGVGDADPAEVTRLEAEQESVQEQVQQQPPAFGSQFYGFDLPENTDGSANRISLGTVSAVDPEGDTLTYSIEGGNAAGLFEIDAASGELFYTGTGEDYETGSTSFELTVRASDVDETTDTTVTVSVADVDEPVEGNPPVAQPDQSTPQTVSEPAGEDFSAGTSTSGRVAVGDTATGNIGSNGDRDWFAVELVAGRTYVIDLRGSPTDDGTLSDPYLGGIHDSDGNLIARTTNDDGGQGYNSRVTFTATKSGTHYIAAGAAGIFSGRGTYEVEVTDTSPPEPETAQAQDEAASVSEPEGQDLPDDTSTTGVVVVGGIATGYIDHHHHFEWDYDWFAVDLVAGRTYVIDLRSSGTDGRSLRDPELYGVFNSEGTRISDTYDDDGGDGLNSRVTITATESATHYISAGAWLGSQGAYELEVTDTTDISEPVEPIDDFAAGTDTTGVLAFTSDTSVALEYGEIDTPGDVDWIAINLEANQSVILRVTGFNPETRTYVRGIEQPQIKGIYTEEADLLPDTSTGSPNYFYWFGPDSRIQWFGGHSIQSLMGEDQWREARLAFRAAEAGTYYVEVGSLNSAETGKYTLAVSPGPTEDDFTDDILTSGEVAVGGSVQGSSEWEDDVDWFAVELTAGVRYQFELAGAADVREYPVFGRHIWDSRGNPYASWRAGADPVVSPDNTINHGFFLPEESGTYYIPVSSGSRDTFWHSRDFWDDSVAYTLTVTVAEEQPPVDDYSADATNAGELVVGESTDGEIGTIRDVDWFAVDLVAGKSYAFVQKGDDNDDYTLPSPQIDGIYDSEGSRIDDTSSDEQSMYGTAVTFEATETGTHYIAASSYWHSWDRIGTYVVEAHEIESDAVPADTTTTETTDVRLVWFSVELNSAKPYVVKVGEAENDGAVQPYKVDIYDADGTRPYTLESWKHDSNFVEMTQILRGRENAGGTHYVVITTDDGNVNREYTVEAHEVDSLSAYYTGEDGPTIVETADVTAITTDADLPEWSGDVGTRWATGTLETFGDVDWIKVELEAGQNYEFEMGRERSFGNYLSTDGIFTDGIFTYGIPDMGLYDSDGERVAAGDHAFTFNYEAAAGGTYYVAVGESVGHYRVTVEEQVDGI